jgi:hypothetical protein
MTMDRQLEEAVAKVNKLVALMSLEHGLEAPALGLEGVDTFIKAYQAAAEEAAAEAAAEAEKAAAEAEVAEAAFIEWLDANGFVGFAGKGGKIACLLEARLDRAANQEAAEVFGLLQAQAPEGFGDPRDRLLNLEVDGENRYLLQVHLNLKGKGKQLRLARYGGYEVKYYFTK